MEKKYGVMALLFAGILILVLPGQVAAWRNSGSYPVTLDSSNNDCRYPATYMVNSKEFTVWQQVDSQNGNWDIYLRWGNGVTWNPVTPLRITNTANWGNSNNDNCYPDIAATYDENLFCVYIAWQYDDTNSNTWEIETCRVLINAQTNAIIAIGYGRASDTHLTDEKNSIRPAIDIGDYYGEVHLVWEDYQNGPNQPEIYYDRSINGMTWGNDQWISSQDDISSKDPTICAHYYNWGGINRDTVCVLWEEYDNQYAGTPQLFIYTRDFWNQGSNPVYSHGPTLVLNGGTTSSEVDPDVRFIDNEFCYVWSDNRDGNREIYYQKIYYDSTLTPSFKSLLRVTNDNGNDQHPMIDLAKNFILSPPITEIHIVWDTNRNGNLDVYACRGVKNAGGSDTISSSGQGGTDNRVSFTSCDEDYPDINAKNQYGYCVFEKNSNTPWEIKYTMDP